jgi:hypothetical protein
VYCAGGWTLLFFLLATLAGILSVLVVQYEKEGFDDVRQRRNLDNFLDLMAPEHFEKVLLETFAVNGPPVLDLPAQGGPDPKHSNYKCKQFQALIEACSKADIKDSIDSQVSRVWSCAASIARSHAG